MNTIVLSIGIFIGSLAAHSVLHKTLLHRPVITLWSTFIYSAGFVILLALVWPVRDGVYVLPSIVLYILLTFNTVLWYIFLLHGGVIPSSVILASFSRNHMQTYRQIRGLFQEKNLIEDRLEDLIGAKIIVRRNAGYTVTAKGKWIVRVITVYSRIFHQEVGG